MRNKIAKPVSSALIMGGLLLASLGCAVLDLREGDPAPAPVTLPKSTSTPTLAATSVAPTLAPSSTPDLCPLAQDLQPPALSDNLDDNFAAIEAYLNQGGDAKRLQLGDQETCLREDVTGDGSPETVLCLVDPNSEQILPRSILFVFTCREGSVELLYRYEPGDWYGLNLIAVTDLTEDGEADVVFSDVSCGAHTCWHTPYVWSWDGDDFVDQIGVALQFPYPDFRIDTGSLVVVSGGIGSVGAGPQRPVTTTLSWDGQAITVMEETMAPPQYRYHALLDGDLAFAQGDLATAAMLYERVVQDETLTSWGALVTSEEEVQALKALGQWRLMVLSYVQEGQMAAESYYTELLSWQEPSAVGDAVKVLAERFRRSVSRDGDVLTACSYAIDTDAAQIITGFLSGFGYANPVFEQPDLCPHLRH